MAGIKADGWFTCFLDSDFVFDHTISPRGFKAPPMSGWPRKLRELQPLARYDPLKSWSHL